MDWLSTLLSIIGSAALAAIGVWAYRRRAQVDMEKAPLEVLSEAFRSRDQQMQMLLTNHLDHDRQERESLVKTLVELNAASQAQTQAIRELSGEIRDSREESANRARSLHERLNAIHLDVRGKA